MNFKKETGIRWPTVSAKVFVVRTSHHIESIFNPYRLQRYKIRNYFM